LRDLHGDAGEVSEDGRCADSDVHSSGVISFALNAPLVSGESESAKAQHKFKASTDDQADMKNAMLWLTVKT
jgi:hypothetical protein